MTHLSPGYVTGKCRLSDDFHLIYQKESVSVALNGSDPSDVALTTHMPAGSVLQN